MSETILEQVPDWDLTDRMRKSLRHADLGMQEMADYLGVSRTSVSSWVNGRIRPSTRTLRVWALRTGVPFAWLSDGSNPRVESGNLTFRRSPWSVAA